MAIFQRSSGHVATAIAAVDRQIAEQQHVLHEAALAGALDQSDTRADVASAEIARLTMRREALLVAKDVAEAAERDSDQAKLRRQAEAAARGCDQFLSQFRKAAAGMAEGIAALAKHYKDGRDALGKISTAVGSHMDYPGCSVAALQIALHTEIYRVSAEPTSLGDRSEIAQTPVGVGPAHRIEPLEKAAARLTKHWAQLHREALGIAQATEGSARNTGAAAAGEKSHAAAQDETITFEGAVP